MVFAAAMVLALVYPNWSGSTQVLVTPALVVAMTLSMAAIEVRLEDFRSNTKSIIHSFLLNYVFLSGVILVSSRLLISDPDYLLGFVLMVATPPAVAIVPFTYLLKGDGRVSVLAEVACYVAALVLAPLIVLSLAEARVDVAYFLEILFLLILLPLVLSRLLRRARFTVPGTKSIVNLCFVLISYSVIGLNQHVIVSAPLTLLPVITVVFLRTIAAGTLVYVLLRLLRVDFRKTISYTLFAAYKNNGAVAVLALLLFGVRAALPASIASFLELAFIIYIQQLIKIEKLITK